MDDNGVLSGRGKTFLNVQVVDCTQVDSGGLVRVGFLVQVPDEVRHCYWGCRARTYIGAMTEADEAVFAG